MGFPPPNPLFCNVAGLFDFTLPARFDDQIFNLPEIFFFLIRPEILIMVCTYIAGALCLVEQTNSARYPTGSLGTNKISVAPFFGFITFPPSHKTSFDSTFSKSFNPSSDKRTETTLNSSHPDHQFVKRVSTFF
jgi:hypothetical protein